MKCPGCIKNFSVTKSLAVHIGHIHKDKLQEYRQVTGLDKKCKCGVLLKRSKSGLCRKCQFKKRSILGYNIQDLPKWDLNIPELAYWVGFFQTDGNLYKDKREGKNRGKFSISLSIRDKNIIYKLKKFIPVYCSISYRTQDTNFKKDYKSIVLTISDIRFRRMINELGVPYGKKSDIIKPPKMPFSEIDYIRGLIDGDGSLGFEEGRGVPFISLTTDSEDIAQYYKKFILEKTGIIKRDNRNKRDKIYNIMLQSDGAVSIVKILYTPKCLCINRKYKAAKKIIGWERPKHWKVKIIGQLWSKDQDLFITSHSISESIAFLKRSKSSIKTRLWRLKCLKLKVSTLRQK